MTTTVAREDVRKEIVDIVVAQLKVAESQVTDSATFTEDLQADSLMILELFTAIEEHFNLDIPDEDAEKLETVAQAVDYIINKLVQKMLIS